MPDFSCHGIHRLSGEAVLKRLESGSGGLSSNEAQRRLAQYGANILEKRDRYSLPRGLLRHFTHFLAVLLLSFPLLFRAYLFLGLIEAGIAMEGFFIYLYSQGWFWGQHLDWSSPLYRESTTVTFAGIVFAQIANVFACRSDHLPVARLGWFTNPFILRGILAELIILTLITYTPIGNEIFGTSPLSIWIFGPLMLGALALLLAEEGRKIIVNMCHRRITTGITKVSSPP